MPESFLPDHGCLTFEQFYARFYPKLVEWLVQHGMRREEAVETSQDICLEMYQSWAKITNPKGWSYRGARWRLTDRGRRLEIIREQPLVTIDADGHEVEIDLSSEGPDIALVLDARERMHRHWQRFLKLFEVRAEGYDQVVRHVKILVGKRAPEDQVAQFLEAYQLVFTGTGVDKRDSRDVQELADKLNMTAGALRTAFSRLQPIWYECALETYLKGVFSAI